VAEVEAPPKPSLGPILSASSIAVVGASDNPNRIGGRIVDFLKRHYRGSILPVNPNRQTVQGLPAAASVAALDAAPDLAVIAVPADDVVATVGACAARGIRGAVVFSAGFAEAGTEGASWQAELAGIAASGIRIFGPNCLGFINCHRGIVATFAENADEGLDPGGVALVSQSGAVGAYLFKAAQRTGIRAGYFCSTGNEVDVTVTEVLRHLVEQDEVRVLAAFAESVRRPDLLLETARRAHELGKSVLFMKAGRSEAGSRAALSHTGSLAGSHRALDAVLCDYGVLAPRSLRQLLEWTRALAAERRPEGGRVAVVTTSGGAGIILADAAAEMGLELPELCGPERAEIEGLIPSFGSAANPIDCTGQVVNDLSGLGRVISLAAGSTDIDTVCVSGLPDRLTAKWSDPIRSALEATAKPLVAWCPTDTAVVQLAEIGIPAYTDPGAAIGAVAAMVARASFASPPDAIPPDEARIGAARSRLAPLQGRPFLLEPDAKAVLSLYGVPGPPERIATDAAEAAKIAAGIGFPVVLKALSYALPHKSDKGGVVLRLGDAEAVVEAARDLERRLGPLDGILVQGQSPPGIELACGFRRDPEFGPVLHAGLGGTLIEILDAGVLLTAPCTPSRALSQLRSLAGGRLLSSRRGISEPQAEALAHLIAGLSALAMELPEVTEVDLNPVIAAEDELWVVDALLVVG
jgi:acetate---CoA ligase (ADP-forming)